MTSFFLPCQRHDGSAEVTPGCVYAVGPQAVTGEEAAVSSLPYL